MIKLDPKKWLKWGIVFVSMLLAWQFLHYSYKSSLIPSSIDILKGLFEVIYSGNLLPNLAISVFRIITGFAAGALLAILLGTLMGYFEIMQTLFGFFIELIRPIPPISWIPLAILWFGMGDGSAIYIIAYAAFFPCLINTFISVRNVDRQLIRAGLTLGCDKSRIIRYVIIPSSLPGILVGARLGLSTGWLAVVAAELVGAQSGIGYMVIHQQLIGRYDLLVVYMIIIGLIGFLMDNCLDGIISRLYPWSAISYE